MSAVLPCWLAMLGSTSGLRRADATVASSPSLAAGMNSPGAAGGGRSEVDEEEKEEEDTEEGWWSLLPSPLARLEGRALPSKLAILKMISCSTKIFLTAVYYYTTTE